MTDYDQEVQAAALAEIAQLKTAFEAAETALETARENLRVAIVHHLMERHAPPGLVADASPYDRNHVRRIADKAGVPPLRDRTVRSLKPQARKKTGGTSSG